MTWRVPEKLRRSRRARVAAGACVLAVVFGAQLWLANLALPVDVDATDKFSGQPVRRSQHELLLAEPVPGFAEGQLLVHGGAANEIVDVHLDRATLDPESAADLLLEPNATPQSISYSTPDSALSPAASGEPCRTSVEIEVAGGRPPSALRLYQLEDGAGRSRHLEVKADDAPLVVRMSSTLPPRETADETEGCRKTLRVGAGPGESLPADTEVTAIAAPGSAFRFSFRPLDRDEALWDGGAEGFYAPFKLGSPQIKPNDPLPSLRAREVSVRRLQEDGAQLPPLLSARSADGAPPLRLYELKLGADELRVKVSGKAAVSVNGRAETYDALKRLEDRQILATILGTVNLALLVWFVRLLRPNRDAAT